jgi:hypothetical protein
MHSAAGRLGRGGLALLENSADGAGAGAGGAFGASGHDGRATDGAKRDSRHLPEIDHFVIDPSQRAPFQLRIYTGMIIIFDIIVSFFQKLGEIVKEQFDDFIDATFAILKFPQMTFATDEKILIFFLATNIASAFADRTTAYDTGSFVITWHSGSP